MRVWIVDDHTIARRGLSNEEIAARLAVPDCTVRSHIHHLMAKLHLANRLRAALYALHEGISSLDEEVGPCNEDFRSTPVGPFGISSDNNLIGHPSSVDP